jgi:hypothetical protein
MVLPPDILVMKLFQFFLRYAQAGKGEKPSRHTVSKLLGPDWQQF